MNLTLPVTPFFQLVNESSFAAVIIKFLNMIDFALSSSLNLNVTNHIEEFCNNSCKAAFFAKRSLWISVE